MQGPATAYTFFDDENPKPTFEFIKPTSKHQKELSVPATITSTLTCKELSSNSSKSGTFAFQAGLLAFYAKGITNQPDFVLELNYAKIKSPAAGEASGNCTLQLLKNGDTVEITFPDKQTMESWISVIRSVGVMTNFHDEYKAIKMIGKGSFAKVYLVEAKSDTKQYAVKAFAKESIGIPNKANPKSTMINEINLMRTLDHDNIIKLYEVHETERSIYLVMELITGKSLQEPLSRHTFKKDYTEKQVVEMIRSILDALAYIASKGIMHRDLKPDNILVDKGGKLKIVDFGLATVIDLPEYIFKKCGTPGYISPEVFKYDQKVASTHYNDKCDVFSAGCIGFYLLMGSPFFDGSGASEILQQNKEFTEFQALHLIKKEQANPKSKVNKEGLNLMLQLLEYDHKKRITASQALNHSYFTPIIPELTKGDSVRDSLDSPNKISLTEINSPTAIKNTMGSLKSELSERAGGAPFSPSRNRFTQKDSLFLDVGRPDFNGKVDTLTAGSANNSIMVKPDINSINSNNSVSSFAGKNSPVTEKNKGQNKSFKGAGPGAGHNFLKAAIFNNMKNSEKGDGDNTPTSATIKNNHEGRHGEAKSASPRSDTDSRSESGSDEIDDDIGDEDCQIESNFAKMKSESGGKRPSKIFSPSRGINFASKKK